VNQFADGGVLQLDERRFVWKDLETGESRELGARIPVGGFGWKLAPDDEWIYMLIQHQESNVWMMEGGTGD
jgi:hypothetical protein